jgi:hypothetical protein
MPYDISEARAEETRRQKAARSRSEAFANGFFKLSIVLTMYSFVLALLKISPMRSYPPISDAFYLFIGGGIVSYICGLGIRFLWSRNRDFL